MRQQFVAGALWTFAADRVVADVGPGQENTQAANMDFLRAHYNIWLQQTKKAFPDMVLTPVGDLSMDLLGKDRNAVLRAKAHETLTLLRWLAEIFPVVADQIPQWGNVGHSGRRSDWTV